MKNMVEKYGECGSVKIPKSLAREGQFALRVEGECLSKRPAAPVLDGDIVIARASDASDLKSGDLAIVDVKDECVYIKDFSKAQGGFVFFRQYEPNMQVGICEGDICGIYKADIVLRDGDVAFSCL